MLPWIAAALAAESSVALSDWTGGSTSGSALEVSSTSATFAPGEMTSFTLTAHARLVEGNGFSVAVGDSTLTLNYTATGGISLGDTSVPFPATELAWTADAEPILAAASSWEGTSLTDPELLEFGGTWLLYYTGADAQIGVATSTSLSSWTRYADAILTGTAPTAVVDGEQVVVFSACDGAICRATSDDGLVFSDDGIVIDAGSSPSATLGDDGTWNLWYTDGDGVPAWATSPDGFGFTDPTPLDARLDGVDVTDGAYGYDGVYPTSTGVALARGGDDATFADASSDLVPIVSADAASWSSDGVQSAAMAIDGTTPHLVYAGGAGDDVLGHAVAAPEPGSWATLTLSWDGTTLSASWNGGPTLTQALGEASSIIITADGVYEMDAVDVEWDGIATDTADTGDSADTAGSADSGDSGDSGDSADTASTDTASTDSEPFLTAAEDYSEPGGFGCATARAGSALAALVAAGLIRRARRP